MNLSSYGLVILARVVEPVHFVDLRLNLSTFMDLIFFKSTSWMNPSFFIFGINPSIFCSTSDHLLGDESVRQVDYNQLPIISYGISPSTMWA